MNNPSQESIQFSNESAKRIDDIKLNSDIGFYADINTESSNTLDEKFVASLESNEHLTNTYRKEYLAKFS